MIEFRQLVYLDVQKTGSTHMGWALRHVLGETPLRFRKHGRVRRVARDKVHVISVRNPVSQYVSLFRFGCDHRGAIYRRLKKKGLADLYQPTPEHLQRWLSLILDPANAGLLGEGYRWSGIAPLIGFLSFRVVSLSLPVPLWSLRRLRTREALLARLDKKGLPDYTVRNESLNRDLLSVLLKEQRRLDLAVPAESLEEALETRPRANQSRQGKQLGAGDLTDELRHRILEREWLLCEYFGDPARPATDSK